MTTLVETSEEEPTMAVARAIAEVAWYDAGRDVSLLGFPPLLSLSLSLSTTEENLLEIGRAAREQPIRRHLEIEDRNVDVVIAKYSGALGLS
jgi:hypothetical protein